MQFIDGRRSLPRHPTKRWAKRPVSGIIGGAVHHTAGGDDPRRTAAYHVAPNHTSQTGMPACAYTFYFPKSGDCWWVNDLDDRTWSQGGKVAPDVDGDGDIDKDDGLDNGNTKFLGIVLGGSFDSDYNRSGQEPTAEQILGIFSLWGHLVGHARVAGWPPELFNALGHLTMADLWAHADLGKAACPGRTLTNLLAALRTNRKAGVVHDAKAWQQALLDRGYDLGRWGVDGDWGPTSKAALKAFQADAGLPVTGHRDDRTAVEIFG